MAKRSAKPDGSEKADEPGWSQHLVGHEAAEQAFLSALAKDRLPHAWLITGVKGVGKATLAYRMARRMLSMKAAPDVSAGGLFDDGGGAVDTLAMAPTDPVFRQVAQHAHPDFRVLRRSINPKSLKLRSEIVVDDVREVLEFLRLKPAMGGWRVVIVDCADELNRNAANALLKILEEPPPQSVLILLAHAPKALLPTLLSRCRRLPLRPLLETDIADALRERYPAREPEEIELATFLAEGSLGRAIRILQADGGDLFREIIALLRDWPELPTQKLHDLADRMSGRSGEAIFELSCEILAWWFGRFLRHAARKARPDRELFGGEADLIRRMGAERGVDGWLRSWERASLVFDRVRRVNMDRKQAWIGAMLTIAEPA